jgi:hypothetical protein
MIIPGELYRFNRDGQLFIPVAAAVPLHHADHSGLPAYQRWLCMFKGSPEILWLWDGSYALVEAG